MKITATPSMPRAPGPAAVPVLPRNLNLLTPLLALLLPLLAGCAIEPWVKPYERERLADPIMQFSRNPLADKHREHVHEVREGTRGAVGVQGGGCGCN